MSKKYQAWHAVRKQKPSKGYFAWKVGRAMWAGPKSENIHWGLFAKPLALWDCFLYNRGWKIEIIRILNDDYKS